MDAGTAANPARSPSSSLVTSTPPFAPVAFLKSDRPYRSLREMLPWYLTSIGTSDFESRTTRSTSLLALPPPTQ